MRLIDADSESLIGNLELICEAEHQIYGSRSWGFAIKAKMAIKDEPTAQQWIPCTPETMPKDDEMKLVTCRPKKGEPNVNRAYYMDGYWHGSGSMSNVIAWMDMPKPYKEGNNELI